MKRALIQNVSSMSMTVRGDTECKIRLAEVDIAVVHQTATKCILFDQVVLIYSITKYKLCSLIFLLLLLMETCVCSCNLQLIKIRLHKY